MKYCKSCGKDIGFTNFNAIVNGHKKEMCKTCFFQHLNPGFEKPAEKLRGNLSYEVISSLFVTD